MTSQKTTLLTEALKKHIDRSGKWLRKLLRKMLKFEFTTEFRERYSRIWTTIFGIVIKMFPNINNMKIYLVCGKTDLRKGIDGLAALVTEAFSLDAYDNAIFLFCGTLSDRFKALYWDKTGFVLY